MDAFKGISSRSSGFNSRFSEKCKGFPTNSVVLPARQEIIRNATFPTMKIIVFLLLVSFLLVAMVSPQETLAGSCGPKGCNAVYVAPLTQRAPVTTSASHAFTAIGGSRVADVNLSQEARDVINRGGKEEPLPKGFLMAADRARLIAKQQPLYGWQEDEIGRPVSRPPSHFSMTARAMRNSRGRVLRSRAGPVKPVTAVRLATAVKEKSQN